MHHPTSFSINAPTPSPPPNPPAPLPIRRFLSFLFPPAPPPITAIQWTLPLPSSLLPRKSVRKSILSNPSSLSKILRKPQSLSSTCVLTAAHTSIANLAVLRTARIYVNQHRAPCARVSACVCTRVPRSRADPAGLAQRTAARPVSAACSRRCVR